VAEFIGTFALIFIGAGAAIALGVNHDRPVAFAHGLTILVFIAAFGDISGGHFNPAVTTGLAAAGVFPSRRVVPYMIAQLAGAIVAAWLLSLAFGGPVNNLGATLVDTQRVTYAGAFMFEAVGTCFLCSVVLHTAVRSPKQPGASRDRNDGHTLHSRIRRRDRRLGQSGTQPSCRSVAAGLYREVPLYVQPKLVGAIFAGGMYRWLWKQPDTLASVAAPGGVTAE